MGTHDKQEGVTTRAAARRLQKACSDDSLEADSEKMFEFKVRMLVPCCLFI